MRYNILCGGPAGQGPNFIANIISKGLVEKGFYVFSSREYESRIRGGHNYNIITFSDEPLYSNSIQVGILIALDDVSEVVHKDNLKKDVLIIKEEKSNVLAAGRAFKVLGIDFSILDSELKNQGNYNENISEAKKGYVAENRILNLPKVSKRKGLYIWAGNDGISFGASQSGLDFYYAYPMTPSTGVFFKFALEESSSKYVTVQLESEIAVVNAAIGSAIMGKKAMIGTSGGGFDLMTESLSLAGGAEVPLVMYLAQRPGPATGAATYTAQGDLNMARHSGHGEFIRVVSAPGDPIECAALTSQSFYLTQKYQIPGIILGDKHLADSIFSLTEKPSIVKSQVKIKWPARFTSYESDKDKIANSSGKNIILSVQKRKEKYLKLEKEIGTMKAYSIYGKKNSKNLVIGWGSTKGAILDSIKSLDCKFIQIIYLEPFSKKIKEELKKAKNLILVENNSNSPLSSLIAEKTGIFIEEKNKILKYDGRPFFYEALLSEIKKRLK